MREMRICRTFMDNMNTSLAEKNAYGNAFEHPSNLSIFKDAAKEISTPCRHG
jgi:hypothetical protein